MWKEGSEPRWTTSLLRGGEKYETLLFVVPNPSHPPPARPWGEEGGERGRGAGLGGKEATAWEVTNIELGQKKHIFDKHTDQHQKDFNEK